eukprot:9499705-Pyramimonas_sp.AAC.1
MARGQLAKQWSKCGSCGAWDWNKSLRGRQCRCAKCGGNVKLYEGDGNILHKPGRGARDQEAQQHQTQHQTQAIVEGLIKSLATSVAAPQLVQVTKVLQAQLNPSMATSRASTAEDALRRVSGQWRDANAKHDQAVAAV